MGFCKCRIQNETISSSIVKAKECQRKENELAMLLKSLENTLVENNSKYIMNMSQPSKNGKGTKRKILKSSSPIKIKMG